MEHTALIWDIAGRMATLAVSLAVGVALGHALEALGWTRYLAPLARPLTRLGRLPDSCGGAFVLAFLQQRLTQDAICGYVLGKLLQNITAMANNFCR